jgi:nucleoside-diphosphate kinase
MEIKNLTFAMIKPDAVAAHNSGKIIDMIEANGFEIVRLQKVMISEELAEEFYAVHKSRPFYGELTEFISSAPVIVMALYREDAINKWRELMGATDPAKAASGTVRNLYGTSIGNNAVHGSDSPETALEELSLVFPDVFYEEGCEDECEDEDDECDEDEEDDEYEDEDEDYDDEEDDLE